MRAVPPILLVMDLWSLGQSQGQIATMLGLSSRKVVERIVAKARMIRDPRAVRHATGARILGKGVPHHLRLVARKKQKLDGIEIVPVILKALCVRGHPRLGNVTPSGSCLTCRRMKK